LIPSPPGKTFLPYQLESIAYALARKSALIADEPGLGKTIEAAGYLNASPEIESVLVVCPASLRINWLRELEAWCEPARSIGIVSASGVPLTDVVVASYDALSQWILQFHKRAPWNLMILDEAQYIKNHKAIRARLAKRLTARSSRVLALTGTPVENRPIELYSLLQILDREGWPETWIEYGKRYCDGRMISVPGKRILGKSKTWRTVWDMSGTSNTDELADRLRKSCMVRHRKEDVLKDLPPKCRQIVELPQNGSAPAVFAEWRGAREILGSGAAEDYNTAVARLESLETPEFEKLSKLRAAVALEKVPAVAAHVRDLLDGGCAKVVVFAHHRAVVAELQTELLEYGPALLHGEMAPTDRQASVDRFQTDPETRVFIGSITAAGVGITLTAASVVVFAELDWVPGRVTQAEDRCHRISQRDSVLVQHLVLQGSLDAHMVKMLVEKQMVIDRIVDP
jgi:SWI/SNF-related matrix-associated actin-dependent regulator 1 of chromatin subfamily A